MNYEGPIEAALSTDLRGEPYNFTVWDTYTGAQLVVFKGAKSAPLAKCLQMVDNNYFITANDNIIHIWSIFDKKCQEQRLFLSGRPSCLCISACSNFLVAAIGEMMHIWNLRTGNLLATVEKHYQTISVLKMTIDGTCLVSGGEDGFVLVWSFADLICNTRNTSNLSMLNNNDNSNRVITRDSAALNEPIHTWQDHSCQVTDLCLTSSGLCLVTSLDMNVDIYNLHTGRRLSSIKMPTPIWSVIINRNETQAFVGGQDGKIYEIVMSSIGMSLFNSTRDIEPFFAGHKAKVNALQISFDGTRLISGSADSSCKIWNINSKKMLHDIRHQGAISNLSLLIVPDGLAIKSMSTTKAPLNVKPLKRHLYKANNSSVVAEDLFEDVVYVEHTKSLWLGEVISCLDKVNSDVRQSEQQASDDKPNLMTTNQKLNDDNEWKMKFFKLYQLSAEQIFKENAEEKLRCFKYSNEFFNDKRKAIENGHESNNKKIKS